MLRIIDATRIKVDANYYFLFFVVVTTAVCICMHVCCSIDIYTLDGVPIGLVEYATR